MPGMGMSMMPGMGMSMMPDMNMSMMPDMSMSMMSGMPMHGMVIMSVQVESSPLDNLMSSLISPLVNNLFTSGNRNISHMPQISSNPEKFLSLNYE